MWLFRHASPSFLAVGSMPWSAGLGIAFIFAHSAFRRSHPSGAVPMRAMPALNETAMCSAV